MNPTKVIREKVHKLTDLPNIGPAMERDLLLMGITQPAQLRDLDPYMMHQQLCELTHCQQDPCVIDVFISIVRFMQGDEPKPWWAYTPERKRHLTK